MPRIVFLPTSGNFASRLDFIELDWVFSISSGVIQYNIYRGLTTGGPYTQINTVPGANSQYYDYAVNRATTYYYVVTAFDGTSESVSSNEASATTGS